MTVTVKTIALFYKADAKTWGKKSDYFTQLLGAAVLAPVVQKKLSK